MPEIPEPNLNPLIGPLLNWAAQAPLAQIYSQKGGWEGWAQVELAMRMPFWINGSAIREVDVYKEDKRADIVTTSPVTNVDIIFELKCQSAYQDEISVQGFTNAFVGDLIKVNHSGRKDTYENVPAVVIGIGIWGQAVDEAITTFSDPNFAYYQQVLWTTRANGPTIFYAMFPANTLDP